jgi:5-methylcytosine-specific restriction endonuclease McrA
LAQHGYYWSLHWRALRKAALERDGYCCTVEGCGRRASYVDHIRERRCSLSASRGSTRRVAARTNS